MGIHTKFINNDIRKNIQYISNHLGKDIDVGSKEVDRLFYDFRSQKRADLHNFICIIF